MWIAVLIMAAFLLLALWVLLAEHRGDVSDDEEPILNTRGKD